MKKFLATIVVIILICALGFSLYAAINHHTNSNKNDKKIEHNRKNKQNDTSNQNRDTNQHQDQTQP
ncbi:MAG: hypothetical protein E6294_15910, partial [Klebsiella sp.]|nr:hypothetical protein [Klebsiella sp.]